MCMYNFAEPNEFFRTICMQMQYMHVYLVKDYNTLIIGNISPAMKMLRYNIFSSGYAFLPSHVAWLLLLVYILKLGTFCEIALESCGGRSRCFVVCFIIRTKVKTLIALRSLLIMYFISFTHANRKCS